MDKVYSMCIIQQKYAAENTVCQTFNKGNMFTLQYAIIKISEI